MTVTGHELLESRRGQSADDRSPEFEWSWLVRGSNLATDGATWILANAPLSVYDPVTLRVLWRDQVYWTPKTRASYVFRVTYVPDKVKDEKRELQPGEYEWEFDTTGGTLHITSPLRTMASYHRGKPPYPPAKCGIGLTEQGDVRGIDVSVPALKSTLRYRFPKGIITDAYVRQLEAMTAHKNSALWKGRAAGEVLFMGATGRQGSTGGPELRFNFVRQPSKGAFSIGDINLLGVKGWDYVWVFYKSETDTTVTPNVVTQVPVWAKVEEVYADADFSQLGIGT